MSIKSINKVNVSGKKVLLRVDVNSPVMNEKIIDNPRFKSAAETISYLLRNKAKLVIIAHQGRKNKADFVSLEQHARLLSKYSKRKIKYFDSLFGSNAERIISNLKSGEAVMLANVRDYDDELHIDKINNRYEKFCENFDIFVNDAFSVSHREQGSIILTAKHIPSYAGLALQKEIKNLGKFKLKRKSTVYLLGGAKIDDYLPIFDNLKNKNSKILASGVLAEILLVAKGYNFGYENSWLEKEGYFELLPRLKKLIRKYRKQIILPVDFAIDDNERRMELLISDLPMNKKIWDVGHGTVRIFKKHLAGTMAVFMKGPLGYSEKAEFSYATVEILKEISSLSKKKNFFSLLGGGHLTTTLEKHKIPDNFSYTSISGGALIAYISGQKLPGLEALDK